MVNVDSKTSYKNSLNLIEDTFNIKDSYSDVFKIWCGWLKDNDLGINLYSFNKYYLYLLDNHYSASTININLVMMRNRILFLFDKINNEIDKRAVLEYKMKLLKAPSMPVKAVSNEKLFTRKDINHLISMSGKRTSLIIEFLYVTACRRAELCNVMIKDCNKKRHHVEVSVYGKRNKIRTVLLSPDLYKKILNVFSGKKYIFESLSGNKYSGHAIWDMVSGASAKYLDRHMSPHMIRHTRLTHLYQETSDMKAVSLFAGHASIKTSLDYYVHHGFDKNILLGSISDK